MPCDGVDGLERSGNVAMQKMATASKTIATVFAAVESDAPSSSRSSLESGFFFLFRRRAVGVPTQRRRSATTSTTPPTTARPCTAVVGALTAARFACQGETELARPAIASSARARAASASAPSSRREASGSGPGVLPRSNSVFACVMARIVPVEPNRIKPSRWEESLVCRHDRRAWKSHNQGQTHTTARPTSRRRRVRCRTQRRGGPSRPRAAPDRHPHRCVLRR